MAGNSRKRKDSPNSVNNFVSIVTAAALVIIAILMVVFVFSYISNNNFLGSIFGSLTGESTKVAETEESEEASSADVTEAVTLSYGLQMLQNGDIVYVMDAREAADHDSDSSSLAQDIEAKLGDEGIIIADTGAKKLYYLTNSWLEYDRKLYYFDEYGRAIAGGEHSERAFVYYFDSSGALSEISYNKRYNGESGDAYTGLVSTKSLWVYTDETKSLGAYDALTYKKTTESLSNILGGSGSIQYASPYAYEILDSKIYYLAVASASTSADSYAEIAGKIFSMSPGGDKRYVWAEDAEGFKVIKNSDGDVVIYYYDGSSIQRSDSSEEDENMVVFSEDASYVVDIGTEGRAYLELATGQRVTLESSSFKAGNFTYSLAADGEILGVAEKTTVSTGGYTYVVQKGTSFGEARSRLVRISSSDGSKEVISSEFEGTVYNLHYDFDTSVIIAEYTSSQLGSGILRISKDGDVDLINGSVSSSGAVALYAIQDGTVVLRRSEDGAYIYYTARISDTVPIAAGVDPVPIVEEEEISETPADYDTTNQGPITAETPAAETAAPETTAAGTSIGNGPGGPGSSGGVISPGSTEQTGIGPGGS